MKYNHMLLCTLIISFLFGVLLFVLGCVVRFNQTGLVNSYIQEVKNLRTRSCQVPDPNLKDINICPIRDEFSGVNLGNWADKFGNVIIIIGTLVMLQTLIGVVGALRQSSVFLLLMFLLLVTIVGMEYYLMDIVMDGKGSFHNDARKEMRDKMLYDYHLAPNRLNEFTRWTTAVMLSGKCCGVEGPADFQLNLTFSIDLTGDGPTTYKILNPPACCERSIFTTDKDERDMFLDILTCSADSWASSSQQAVTLGCYNKIHRQFYHSYGKVIMGYLMSMVIWQGIQAILLCMIVMRPQKPKKARESAPVSKTEIFVEPTPKESVMKRARSNLTETYQTVANKMKTGVSQTAV